METQKPTQSTSPWVWVAAALAVLVVIACLCIAVVGVGVGIFGIASVFNTPSVVQVTAVAVAQPVPTLPHSYDPTPLSTPEPAASLPPLTPDIEAFSAELPPRDRYELARRFLGIEEAPTPEPVTYQIGDVTTFWVSNDDLEQTVQVQAELAYANDVVYMWVEVGVPYDLNALRRSADRFAQETFPTNRSFFYDDDSWLPGIDSDPRLHILHSVELGSGIAGYFYSPSAYPAGIVPYSNEKEMFFINIGNTPPGSDYYDAVLAHEFQHMLHWAADPNEESWLGEGLSELAAYLNGFGPSGFAPFYLLDPDIQLTNWPEGGSSGANYGAGYLFTAYFLDRFGQDALQALVANPLNGLEGVDDTLESLGLDTTADEVFADWTVANYLRDPSVGDGRYSYEGMFEQMAVGCPRGCQARAVRVGLAVRQPVRRGLHRDHRAGRGHAKLRGDAAGARHPGEHSQHRWRPCDRRSGGVVVQPGRRQPHDARAHGRPQRRGAGRAGVRCVVPDRDAVGLRLRDRLD